NPAAGKLRDVSGIWRRPWNSTRELPDVQWYRASPLSTRVLFRSPYVSDVSWRWKGDQEPVRKL
ncbi:MAG TPA: hypothetical protein VF074_10205, partial [Pyrinomonadaceae bacterium]